MTDQAALIEVLRNHTGCPHLAYETGPSNLHGGFWAELLVFRLREAPDGWPRDLVARVMPDPAVAAKETIFQAQVATLGFPTPVVRLAGGPEAGLGRAFMIMDRVDGCPLLAGLSGVSALLASPRIARTIPDSLAEAMAHLHSLSPEGVVGRFDGAASSTRPEELLAELEAAAGRSERTDLVSAARWLTTHRPNAGPDVLCHGDLHPFNLLKRDDGVTVVDWSAAIIGPAEYDVAFTSLVLAEPPVAVPPALSPVIRAGGRWLSRRFIRQYAARAEHPLDTDALAWNHGLICLRALVQVSGWVAEGSLPDHRGHPWLVSGPAFASHLGALTGIRLAPE